MLIALTGACGFIGSNILRQLNNMGYYDIIAVDNLRNGNKFKNIVDCSILDYIDKEDFIKSIANGDYNNQIDYIFHQGACSDTTLGDGKYMMKNNYEYSTVLLEFAQENEIPMLYASSASVYGLKKEFIEDEQFESPLNLYGYSKLLFDQIVRRHITAGLKAPVVGLRYFNVYGPNESHKGRMASVVYHHYLQYSQTGKVQLFAGNNGYENGEQIRDFIYVDDVVNANMFFFNNHLSDNEEVSGIFNCGTGKGRTFNELALATINAFRELQSKSIISLEEAIDNGEIEYIAFPNDLIGKYQNHTEANLEQLLDCGFREHFTAIEDGVYQYIQRLLEKR